MVRMDFRRRGGDGGKAPSVGGRLGLSLFFLFFFGMGMLFEVLIVREFGRAVGQRAWKETPCTITLSEVRENRGESPYALNVRYQYDYNGQAFTGSAYKRSGTAVGTYSAMQKLVQRFPAGQSTVCYVNPANPAEAVLKRDSPLIGFVALFPLIFVAIGAGGIYGIWRGPRPERQKPIAAAARAKGRSKYAMAGFFGIFAVIGGAMLYPLGIRPIARTIDAESWVATPCKVLRAEVRSHDSDDGTTYSVYILYEYECNGQTYKSDRYDFVGGSSSGYKSKARVVSEYKSAANPVCYVNPANPSEAVLKRGFHAKLLFALFPLPFLLVGLGGIIYTLRGGRTGFPTPVASGGPIPVSTGNMLSALRPGDTGEVVLRPRFSARTKLVGAIVVAAIWNGIISIFVVDAVGNWRHGGLALLPTLFLVPFVVIGLGMIGFVFYQFLAMFNPRPTLRLRPASIPLGQAAELQWAFTGRTGLIHRLSVTLRGREEATYRRGTNTVTDKSTFYEMELYSTADWVEMTSGRVGFVMPQDTMHSFRAQNNKIIWEIAVHGTIERWPDVKESFEIEVAPVAGGR
jgi:hypothetical protein